MCFTIEYITCSGVKNNLVDKGLVDAARAVLADWSRKLGGSGFQTPSIPLGTIKTRPGINFRQSSTTRDSR